MAKSVEGAIKEFQSQFAAGETASRQEVDSREKETVLV
jgi:hypothetical protein